MGMGEVGRDCCNAAGAPYQLCNGCMLLRYKVQLRRLREYELVSLVEQGKREEDAPKNGPGSAVISSTVSHIPLKLVVQSKPIVCSRYTRQRCRGMQ